MAVRVDEDGVRRGSAADAGALCRTKEKPRGVSASTYRRMCSQLGAPRPLKTIGPDGREYDARNPLTGEKEYDLGAVADWHAHRDGPGAWHHDITHRTPMRHQLLAEVAAGKFTATIEGMQVRIYRNGALFTGEARLRANTRVFSDMQRGGMLLVPETGGQVDITEKARPVLERWDAEERAEREAQAKARARSRARRPVVHGPGSGRRRRFEQPVQPEMAGQG